MMMVVLATSIGVSDSGFKACGFNFKCFSRLEPFLAACKVLLFQGLVVKSLPSVFTKLGR